MRKDNAAKTPRKSSRKVSAGLCGDSLRRSQKTQNLTPIFSGKRGSASPAGIARLGAHTWMRDAPVNACMLFGDLWKTDHSSPQKTKPSTSVRTECHEGSTTSLLGASGDSEQTPSKLCTVQGENFEHNKAKTLQEGEKEGNGERINKATNHGERLTSNV